MQLYYSAVLAVVMMASMIQQLHASAGYKVILACNYAYTHVDGQYQSTLPTCVDHFRTTETGQALCKTYGQSLKNVTYVYFGYQISSLYISCQGGETSIYDCPTQHLEYCAFGINLFCE